MLYPAYTVILASADRLLISEAVGRHLDRQGQEIAFRGPLVNSNLLHPPCHRFAANGGVHSARRIPPSGADL